MGMTFAGNEVTPACRVQPPEHATLDAFRLCPTTRVPEPVTKIYATPATPVPPLRVAVALLVTVNTWYPKRTLQGEAGAQLAPMVSTVGEARTTARSPSWDAMVTPPPLP